GKSEGSFPFRSCYRSGLHFLALAPASSDRSPLPMLRWIFLAILVVAIAVSATLAVNYLSSSRQSAGSLNFPVKAKPKGPLPVLTVEAEPEFFYETTGVGRENETPPAPTQVKRFDRTGKMEQNKKSSVLHFGTLPQKVTATHVWTLKNSGKGDLILYRGASSVSGSSKSQFATFNNEDRPSITLAPGEKTEFRLTFAPRANNGAYSKGATIITNDPNHEQFLLEVQGEVHPVIMTHPAESVVNFKTISNDVPENSRTIALYSTEAPDMKITKVVTTKPDVITTKYEPLNDDDRKQLDAKGGGYRVTFSFKPGLPLGTFREEAIVEIDHPAQAEQRLILVGKVVGPILAVPEVLTMHNVFSPKGAEG